MMLVARLRRILHTRKSDTAEHWIRIQPACPDGLIGQGLQGVYPVPGGYG